MKNGPIPVAMFLPPCIRRTRSTWPPFVALAVNTVRTLAVPSSLLSAGSLSPLQSMGSS